MLTSIGYHGKAINDLPFDDKAGVVPNDGGRVIDPDSDQPVDGAYVAGWIKRGPTGFIGTNKSCALQTVQRLVDDYNAGTLRNPIGKPSALDKLVAERQSDVVDAAGWRAIDAAEVARGKLGDRPRNKFTSVTDMLEVAAAAPAPPLRRRLADRLRELADLLAGCWPERGDLVHADLAHGLTQRPVVAERIGDHAVAVAPELVVERGDHGGAGVECPLELGIDVGHRQVDGDRSAAQRRRGHRLSAGHLREVVVEHHGEAVDAQRGVDQLAVGTGHSADFLRVKSLDVEVDRRGGVVDDKVRGQCGFDGDCHVASLVSVRVRPFDSGRDAISSLPTDTDAVSRRQAVRTSFQPSTDSGLRGSGPT